MVPGVVAGDYAREECRIDIARLADAAGARMRHLDETGVYCHVIADGGMSKGGDIAKAIAAGVEVTYREYAGTIHGFASYRGVIPSARDDVADMLAAAREMLARA